MSVSIDREIDYLQKISGIGPYLAQALRRLRDGVNNLGINLSADSSQTLPAPPPINELTVKTNGTGLVHAVIIDNNQIQKHLHYFVEYDTKPSFPQPHVVHLGVSRSMQPLTLPAMDDEGKPQSFYFRAYSQYLGGAPGDKVALTTAINPGGTQQMTLIPSTGSGTAVATGQQGGKGFGPVLFRPSSGTRRRFV